MPSSHQLARAAHHAAHERSVTTPDRYYSRHRWQPIVTTAAGINTYTLTTGKKTKAFAYASGQAMDAAYVNVTAFPTTDADTNLVGSGAQTIGGHTVEITGLIHQVSPRCRAPRLTALLFTEAFTSFFYQGKQIGLQIGPPYFIPGGPRLEGLAQNAVQPAAIPGGPDVYGHWGSGLSGCDNYLRIPEKMYWRSAGMVDSNFTIVTELTRDISDVGVANEAPAAGVRGFTQATAAEAEVDLMFMLYGTVYRERSGVI
jgi:hypothetical protein